MTSANHYPNAPITEAVIDIQLTSTVSAEALLPITKDNGEYPAAELLNTTRGAMMIGPADHSFTTVTTQPIGYINRSNDSLRIYQVRTNGFTFSRLAPYPHWSVFQSEARAIWVKYRSIAQPTAITRVALRYINRLDIPMPITDFADYLRTMPVVSPDLPQGLSGYFMQLALPLPEVSSTAVINQTIIPSNAPDISSIVLDIDIYRNSDLPQDDERLWDLLELLRDTKNKVFEACITDNTRRLFQ